MSFSPPSSPPPAPPSALEMREFDLILFGATSFVGYFTIRELLLTLEQNPSEYAHFRWAIAGRNASKMADVVRRLCSEVEELNLETTSKSTLQSIPIIAADVEDAESLETMASRTTLLINTVGPYLLYGRPVVEACLASGTHYLDLSAEIHFNETLQVDAHARAKEAGVCVVNCCGWASVPVDLGVAYLKKEALTRKIQLTSVEAHVDVKPCPKNGYRLHTGTWDSMLTVYVRFRDLKAIRQMLFSDEKTSDVLPATVPYIGPKFKQQLVRFPKFKRSSTSVSPNHLELFFPGPDVSVVKRSQHYNYRHFAEEPPVQVAQYIRVRAVANQLLGFPLIFALFWHRPGRWLLKKNVKLYTAGFISPEGPTRAQIEGTTCNFTLVGRGYSVDSLKNSTDSTEKKTKPGKKMKLKIECSEPAYLATSTFLVQSALSLLVDFEDVPTRGVLTSASAFQRTKLIERLKGRGITFNLESL